MHHRSIRDLASHLALAVVAAVVAIVLTGGGLAGAQQAPETGQGVAEAIAAPNTVNSAAIINGAVTSQDIANGTVTGQDITNGTIGRADIKPGVAPLYAKVDADVASATMVSSKGASSTTFIAAGQYRVTFNRSVVGCGWSATLNDNDAGAALPGEITVERDTAGDNFSLRVRTFDSAGALAAPGDSDGFTLMVAC